MAVYFFDTSALVKRYATETGSGWVRRITDPKTGNKVYITTITGVEVVSALTRKVRNAEIQLADAQTFIADFRIDFQNQYELFRVTDPVIQLAMKLPEKYKLRAYDAIQLAAAMIINDQSNLQGIAVTGVPALVLVASDKDLLDAAQAEGLVVDDPEAHP